MKTKEEIEALIVSLVCRYNDQVYDILLKDEPIVNFRLDSVNAVTIVNDLEADLEVELFPTLFWEFPTIAEIADWILEQQQETSEH